MMSNQAPNGTSLLARPVLSHSRRVESNDKRYRFLGDRPGLVVLVAGVLPGARLGVSARGGGCRRMVASSAVSCPA